MNQLFKPQSVVGFVAIAICLLILNAKFLQRNTPCLRSLQQTADTKEMDKWNVLELMQFIEFDWAVNRFACRIPYELGGEIMPNGG